MIAHKVMRSGSESLNKDFQHNRLPAGRDDAFRTDRDATLAPPRLIFQAVQINANGGVLPPKEDNGFSFLKIPLNLFG